MQTTKFRSIGKILLTKNSLRSVTSKSSIENASEDTQLKSWREIPGPSSLPIIGQLHHFIPGGSYAGGFKTLLEKLYAHYGPIVRLDSMPGRPPFIFLYDPECFAQILRGENSLPVRPGFQSLEYYRKYYKKTKGQQNKPTGLITDHGENWKQFRSTVNPVMLQPKTIRLYASVLDEVAQDTVTRIKSRRDANNMIKEDLDIEMNLWGLESIGVVALGGRLNCLDLNLAENSPAKKLIRCVHEVMQVALDLDFKPSLWRFFSTPSFRKAMRLYKEQEELAKYFIHESRKNRTQEKNKTEEEKSILDKLLEINEEVALTMSVDMLFAGIDTAATTITGAMYMLAMNPDKQKKLREELKSDDDNKRYLKACIKEGLRLYPPAFGNIRQTTKEYNLLGYRIPKDMLMIFEHQMVSNWESQYPRPDEFIPERWIDKEGPFWHGNAHPFAYSPFGFGVRMCVGRRIAELELESLLARMVLSFHIEWIGPPPVINQELLSFFKKPFNFVFKDI